MCVPIYQVRTMDIQFNSDKHYYGQSCVKCGCNIRYIKGNRCIICAKRNRDDYRFGNPEKVKGMKDAYRANNQDKIKESDRLYRENNQEKIKASQQAYQERYPERVKETKRKSNATPSVRASKRRYAEENRELIAARAALKRWIDPEPARARGRRYAQKHAERLREERAIWYEDPVNKASESERKRLDRLARPEVYAERNREYTKNNPEKVRAASQKRRAIEAGAYSEPYDFDAICALFGRCVDPECDDPFGRPLTPDHIIPLSWTDVDGADDAGYNIQPLCQPCNSSKGNRHDTDYRLLWIDSDTLSDAGLL